MGQTPSSVNSCASVNCNYMYMDQTESFNQLNESSSDSYEESIQIEPTQPVL